MWLGDLYTAPHLVCGVARLKRFSFFDIPGFVWVGLFSLQALVLSTYTVITEKALPASYVTLYLGVIAAYATNRTITRIKEPK